MDLDTEKVINLVFPDGIPGKSLEIFISCNTLLLLLYKHNKYNIHIIDTFVFYTKKNKRKFHKIF